MFIRLLSSSFYAVAPNATRCCVKTNCALIYACNFPCYMESHIDFRKDKRLYRTKFTYKSTNMFRDFTMSISPRIRHLFLSSVCKRNHIRNPLTNLIQRNHLRASNNDMYSSIEKKNYLVFYNGDNHIDI